MYLRLFDPENTFEDSRESKVPHTPIYSKLNSEHINLWEPSRLQSCHEFHLLEAVDASKSGDRFQNGVLTILYYQKQNPRC